ncbi:hypothetical protein NDU88_004047 [Pleurodeles waltl]|uniref:Secreted protein n=1 Tax=Pleurodeles waltl TaxID=8319 RepID=A0AAV7NLL1_PLEWA|nr:hypothetical protein NDU88_004047 [Pleurodeles waltl]
MGRVSGWPLGPVTKMMVLLSRSPPWLHPQRSAGSVASRGSWNTVEQDDEPCCKDAPGPLPTVDGRLDPN